VITALVGAGSACFGFAGGLLYAARRLPRWLADMSDEQRERLFERAGQAMQ